MRVFAIGDIHGRYDLLDNLLNILQEHHNLNLTEDKLIFMGDYIDRGPQSLQVLDKLFDLQRLYPKNVVCLRGNHEQLMIDWFDGRDKWGLWLVNGGRETLASFINVDAHLASILNLDYLDARCPKTLMRWVKKLPLSYEMQGFFFSHAPIPAKRHFINEGREYTREELTWSCPHGISEELFSHDFGTGVVGVCGHIHALRDGVFAPRLYDHYIFTDAGCGCHKDAPLCAVEVLSRQIIYSVLGNK